MGTYTAAYWPADGRGIGRVAREGGQYRSYTPNFLAGRDLPISNEALTVAAEAGEAVSRLNAKAQMLAGAETIARLLLRSEALSSSRIENLTLPSARLFEEEALEGTQSARGHRGQEAAQVLANIYAMEEAVDRGFQTPGLELGDICHINRVLLKDSHLAEIAGVVRSSQNWIGGNSSNPVGARYVPPAPNLVSDLLDDLLIFCNTASLPAVALAAIAHAQFETIHPFADGNGRTGRALIHIMLKRTGVVDAVAPPISLILATDKENYLEKLESYRFDGPADSEAEAQAMSEWVKYFASIVGESCVRAEVLERELESVRALWQEKANFRRNSAGRAIMDILPGHPAGSVATYASLTGKGYEPCRQAVNLLVERGILSQSSRNKKQHIYVAHDIVEAFGAYERSLATLSGDTSIERPRRPVPQR